MQKISPYNPVIIETARLFNEAHNGCLLIEMIHDIEEHGDESPFHFIFNADDALLDGSRQANVGMRLDQISYIGFLQYVAIAQAHIQREGEEISNLTLQIMRNFSGEDVVNVRNKTLEIGESLGNAENSFYNFLIDILNQIYELKLQAGKVKIPVDDYVKDSLSGYDLEKTLLHANFGLKGESLSDTLGIILWAAEGPANEIEITEAAQVDKND